MAENTAVDAPRLWWLFWCHTALSAFPPAAAASTTKDPSPLPRRRWTAPRKIAPDTAFPITWRASAWSVSAVTACHGAPCNSRALSAIPARKKRLFAATGPVTRKKAIMAIAVASAQGERP
jgi:hypothetical protein